MRRASKVLTANSGVTITAQTDGNNISVIFDGGSKDKVVAVINNTKTAYEYTLPDGDWSLVANASQAGAAELVSANGRVTVDAQSVFVYFSK